MILLLILLCVPVIAGNEKNNKVSGNSKVTLENNNDGGVATMNSELTFDINPVPVAVGDSVLVRATFPTGYNQLSVSYADWYNDAQYLKYELDASKSAIMIWGLKSTGGYCKALICEALQASASRSVVATPTVVLNVMVVEK